MRPHEILDYLEGSAARLWVSGGRLKVDTPADVITPELSDAIRANRDILMAAVYGRATGHALAPCTSCGESSIVNVRSGTWPTCRMSPDCEGRHEPRPADLPAITRVKAKQATPPPKRDKSVLLGEQPSYPTRTEVPSATP